MSTYRIKTNNVFVSTKRSNLKAVKDNKEDETEQYQERLKTNQSSKSFYNNTSRSMMNNTESLFNKPRSKRNVPHYAGDTKHSGFDMSNYYTNPQAKKKVNVRKDFKTFDLMGNLAFKIRTGEQKEKQKKHRAKRAKEQQTEVKD